jgi:hypothetical protein
MLDGITFAVGMAVDEMQRPDTLATLPTIFKGAALDLSAATVPAQGPVREGVNLAVTVHGYALLA